MAAPATSSLVMWAVAILQAAPVTVPLANGRLSWEADKSFEVMSIAADGSRLTLRTEGGKGLILVDISTGSEGERSKLVDSLLAKLRKEGKTLGAEIVQPAAEVESPGIVAKVIDTIKVDGKTQSRSRSVRKVGGWVIEMFAIAKSEKDGEREELLNAAQDKVLRKISPPGVGRGDVAAKADKRIDLPVGLNVAVPTGVDLKTTTAREGVVASGKSGSAKFVIVVTAIVRAAEGTEDDFVTAADQRALAAEDAALSVPSLPDPQKVQDGRFWKRERRVDNDIATDRRVRKLGNALVSVAMITKRTDEEAAAKTADALAASINPK